MQGKSVEKYSVPDRLRKLYAVMGKNWSDVATALIVSEPYIYAVLSGKKEFGPKPLHRLEQLEIERGIIKSPPTIELREGEDLRGEVDVWKRRAKNAEKELADLRDGLRSLLEQGSFRSGTVKRPASSKPVSELAEHERLLDAAEDKGRDS